MKTDLISATVNSVIASHISMKHDITMLVLSGVFFIASIVFLVMDHRKTDVLSVLSGFSILFMLFMALLAIEPDTMVIKGSEKRLNKYDVTKNEDIARLAEHVLMDRLHKDVVLVDFDANKYAFKVDNDVVDKEAGCIYHNVNETYGFEANEERFQDAKTIFLSSITFSIMSFTRGPNPQVILHSKEKGIRPFNMEISVSDFLEMKTEIEKKDEDYQEKIANEKREQKKREEEEKSKHESDAITSQQFQAVKHDIENSFVP